ncbi:hypothetical protein SS50377_21165 [Spironucleus salmonicida]|uniref:Uncharacterized protein n=1 Tax=Spironucleus salmonicida TaxID=348837 RepID=A0A9P8M0Q8_9EUKA|nr:hypothetical protein SS50377_21165 [Spironucleus salmonicida]
MQPEHILKMKFYVNKNHPNLQFQKIDSFNEIDDKIYLKAYFSDQITTTIFSKENSELRVEAFLLNE